VRGGQRGHPFGDLRGPAERLQTERLLLSELPSLRHVVGPKPITRKVDSADAA
jgi:hypothetical protein